MHAEMHIVLHSHCIHAGDIVLEALVALPESMGELSALTHLDMSGCGQLRELPESLSRLVSLVEWDASYCKQISALPALDRMVKLTKLSVASCSELSSLPSGWSLPPRVTC